MAPAPPSRHNIPNDAAATENRARADADALLANGAGTAYLCRAELKLPSGVKGERFFALSEEVVQLCGGSRRYIIETINRRR